MRTKADKYTPNKPNRTTQRKKIRREIIDGAFAKPRKRVKPKQRVAFL